MNVACLGDPDLHCGRRVRSPKRRHASSWRRRRSRRPDRRDDSDLHSMPPMSRTDTPAAKSDYSAREATLGLKPAHRRSKPHRPNRGPPRSLQHSGPIIVKQPRGAHSNRGRRRHVHRRVVRRRQIGMANPPARRQVGVSYVGALHEKLPLARLGAMSFPQKSALSRPTHNSRPRRSKLRPSAKS